MKYYLQKNKINGKQVYVARVTGRQTIDRGDMVREMTNRGTTLTATDIRAVLDLEDQVAADLLAQGYRIVTPLYQMSVSIQGVFRGLSDRFVPSRHKIYPTISAGTGLKKLLARARVKPKRVEKDSKPPLLHNFHMLFAEPGAKLTGGGHGMLEGARLQFDREDPEQGLYFEAIETAEQTDGHWKRVKVERFDICESKKIIFQIPELKPGLRYWLIAVGPEGETHLSKPLEAETPTNPLTTEKTTPKKRSPEADPENSPALKTDLYLTKKGPGGPTTPGDSSDQAERPVRPPD